MTTYMDIFDIPFEVVDALPGEWRRGEHYQWKVLRLGGHRISVYTRNDAPILDVR